MTHAPRTTSARGDRKAGTPEKAIDVFVNGSAMPHVDGGNSTYAPLTVHRKLPGYTATPLNSYPDLAAEFGLGKVWVKDESWRLGLPAFKMLGASYAIYRALVDRLGREVAWETITELKAGLAPLDKLSLAAATDGNHGRAVARMARLLGLGAVIYVPEGMSEARIEAIRSEGATVVIVPGDYDAAVRRSAGDASQHCLVISDTSWPGYTRIPTWVAEGYSTVFAEVSDELKSLGEREPDLVLVPVGVGAFATATIQHYKGGMGRELTPLLIGVESILAPCVLESMRAGRRVTVPGPHRSIMAGLNCGTPSQIAWPYLVTGLDAVVAVADGWTVRAMRMLAAAGMAIGETGAAALAGLLAITETIEGSAVRNLLPGPHSAASALILCTEGPTDEAAWAEIVGHPVPIPEIAQPGYQEGAGSP